MPVIKFSHIYKKLHEQTKAVLLDVELTSFNALDKDFVAYDTFYPNEDTGEDSHYPLSKGLQLVLTFKGNKRIPFTTVRRATGKKEAWYRSNIGKEFDIVFVKEEPEAQEKLPL